MEGADIRRWGVLDWLGVGTLLFGALILFLNTGLKDAPELVQTLPKFFTSSAWGYVPFPVMLFGIVLLVISNRRKASPTLTSRRLKTPLFPTQGQFESDSEFKFLPISYALDLSAQLPFVECRFYAVNFHSRELTVGHFKLTLTVYGGPPLENIPLRNAELRIPARAALMVSCRRNLTDAESKALPKRTERNSEAFEMFVKATDKNNVTLTYGPVSSMVIEGSLTAPKEKPEEGMEDIELMSLHSAASRVYEELKGQPLHIWTLLASGAGEDADAILDQIAAFMVDHVALYGRQPPGTKMTRLEVPHNQVTFEGGAVTMRYRSGRLPPCTDLRVKRTEVEELVRRERGNYTPSRRG